MTAQTAQTEQVQETEQATVTREEFLREWAADLRSGRYTQGKSTLSRFTGERRFCCLGVACETGVRLGLLDRVEVRGDGRFGYFPRGGNSGNPEYLVLPDVLADLIEEDPNPYLPDHPLAKAVWPEGARSFADANDNDLLTFPEFAAIIEGAWLSTREEADGGE
jgi:hypothetical protein